MRIANEKIVHQLDIGGACARIVLSNDEGPIRRILNGRRNIRTGTFISFKADLRAMPWESYNGELAVLKLAEGALGIAKLLAQPHRLEIFTKELPHPLIYFPDLMLRVDDELYAGLLVGRPFVTLAAQMRTRVAEANRCRVVIVEVKLPTDPRLHDDFYNMKIALAREVYERLGIPFVTIERTKDFSPDKTLPFADLFMFDRHTKIDDSDYDILRRVFGSNGKTRPYGEVVEALCPGPTGKAKMLGLQIRRRISIDLSKRITDDSNVLYVSQQ